MIPTLRTFGLALLATVLLHATIAHGAYSDHNETWNIHAEIDSQLNLIAPGAGVHIDMTGTGAVTFSNAIPGTSVDVLLTSMTLTGPATIPSLGLTGTATGTLFAPAGSPQGPGTNSGQLTPTSSSFNAYTRIVMDFPGTANDFTCFTGLNNTHGGLKASAFKQDTAVNTNTGDHGFGVYDNTRFPMDFQGSNAGGNPSYMSLNGSHWTITPEPGSLALLALVTPLVMRRRRA